MFGPFAFLAGLAMLGGAWGQTVLKNQQLAAYDSSKFKNGHPIQVHFTTMAGGDIGKWNAYHTSNCTLREYYGGFDYPRLVEEVGKTQANMILEQWAICEMGFCPTFGDALVGSYCWSKEYMSPYLPYAKWLHEHPELLEKLNEELPYFCFEEKYEEAKKYYNDIVPVKEWQHDVKKYIMPVYNGYYKDYDKWFSEIRWCIDKRYPSLNDEKTGGENIFADVEPKPLTIEEYKKDYRIHCRDYVDYLKQTIYIHGHHDFVQERHLFDLPSIEWRVTLLEDKAKKVLSRNRYLKLCRKHAREARALQDQWYVKLGKFDKYDLCEMTKACNTGVHYTTFRQWDHDQEIVEQRYYDVSKPIKQATGERYSYYSDEKHQRPVYYTDAYDLWKISENNYKEVKKLFIEDEKFAVDFMVCWLLEHYYHTRINNDWFLGRATYQNREILKKANNIVNTITRRENKNPRKDQQEENAE